MIILPKFIDVHSPNISPSCVLVHKTKFRFQAGRIDTLGECHACVFVCVCVRVKFEYVDVFAICICILWVFFQLGFFVCVYKCA